MILNPEGIRNKRSFGKDAAYWLMFEAHLPLLSIDNSGRYWFHSTPELHFALTRMPLLLKILELF